MKQVKAVISMNPAFWEMIAERRTQKTTPLAVVRRRIEKAGSAAKKRKAKPGRG